MNMNVLSLFDGISAGQQALKECNIKINNYYASEIDKYAISVTNYNFPNTIQLGDVSKISNKFLETLPKIDLLIGGSPCNGFSNAGKGLNFKDSRSRLFFEYVRIFNKLKKLNPEIKFLLENVNMKKEWIDVISKKLKIKQIRINSSLLSAQNRDRLYWTNIKGITQPEDLNIYFKDIFEKDAPKVHYYKSGGLNWIKNHEKRKNKKLKIYTENSLKKMQMLEATMYKNYSSQRFFGIKDIYGLRYISLLECERAQTFPNNYTKFGIEDDKIKNISNSQRYKQLGNSWTVSVISHIFNNI
jgi:DNA-cytosine methyltransferase